MAAVAKYDEHNKTCDETNSYKTAEGQVVFLTQAESYCHCGPAFIEYSWLEIESTVQLQEKTTSSKNTKNENSMWKQFPSNLKIKPPQNYVEAVPNESQKESTPKLHQSSFHQISKKKKLCGGSSR